MKAKTKSGGMAREKFLKYWQDHPNYTAFVHTTLGVGLGILAQTYFDQGIVNTVGWTLVLIGVLGHFYPIVK